MKHILITIAAVLLVGCGNSAIDSALLEATLIGDINNVKKALNSGANINAQDDIDFTPLQYSARGGHYEIVKLLLEKGASINIKDTIGELPIHKIENLKVTQILIEKGSDINAKNNQLQTPLDNAIKFQKHKIIKLLRKHGGKISEELDAAEQGSKSEVPNITIHEAAGDGNIEVVIQHLDAGIDVNAKQGIPEWTPLHLASQFNRKEVAELLIGKGANVNAKDLSVRTPLHLASLHGCKEVAELLIRKGADMNAKDQGGKTPLDWAIMRKHTETAALLRKQGGKTGSKSEAPDITIHEAAGDGNHDEVKKLFADGVDINMRDTMGLTPLDYANLGILKHGVSVRDFILENGGKTGNWFRADESIQIAVEVGNFEAVKKHLDVGAEVTGKDKLFGHTLLHLAASGGKTEIVEMLLTAGADVNAIEGIQGGTPLHNASTKEIAELLISQGADVNIKNAFFETPIDNAEGDIIGLLRKHGGKSGAEDSIHVAARVGDMKLLMQHIKDGKSVDNKGPIGRTPLHFAAMGGHTEIADYLISNKVNINLEDDRGLTALGIAEISVEMEMGDQRRVKMADLLRKHGGKTGEELKAVGK